MIKVQREALSKFFKTSSSVREVYIIKNENDALVAGVDIFENEMNLEKIVML